MAVTHDVNEDEYVTQQQCQERRSEIEKDYQDLKKRVDMHGKEIDNLNDKDIREDERIKNIESTLNIVSKIMITIAGALGLLVIKGALGI